MEKLSHLPQTFCGRIFVSEEMSLIQEVVEDCSGLSRMELAHTVCELIDCAGPMARSRPASAGSFWNGWRPRGLFDFQGVGLVGHVHRPPQYP